MMRAPSSLARRLTTMVLGFVLVTWVVAVAVAWLVTQHELNELFDAHLAQTAALLATGEVADVDNDGHVQAPPPLLHPHQSRVAFQIWHRGHLRARSADAPDAPLAPPDARGLGEHRVAGTRWRVYTTTRDENGQLEDIIHVGEHASARRHVLLASLRGTLLPLLLALPLLALGILLTVQRAIAPLRRLGASVAARQPQALDPLPEQGVLPEVQPLVHALNELFERMVEQLASERRFTADAAHELRTPISAIRMQAQVAQGASDGAERAQALAATIAGCDRATRLVEQLLQLARLEAEAARPDAACDLGLVAADRVHELQPLAAARGQRITLHAPSEPLPVPMGATFANVLLRNLLDNALRYGPDGGQVEVRVQRQAADGTTVLTVEDDGPGMSEAALARLGERFFRVLGSDRPGSGLGWSIVRRLARLHGLSVQLGRSARLGGLRVRIDWPALAPDAASLPPHA